MGSMKKTVVNKLIALVLVVAGLCAPCAAGRSFSPLHPKERLVSALATYHDVIPARGDEANMRSFARRAVRQQQKSFFGTMLALVRRFILPCLSPAVRCTGASIKKQANKFLLTIQFLQTLF